MKRRYILDASSSVRLAHRGKGPRKPSAHYFTDRLLETRAEATVEASDIGVAANRLVKRLQERVHRGRRIVEATLWVKEVTR